MTTITDPFGTPEVVYNRSGTTIQTLSLVPSHAPYPTASVSGHSIFILSASGAIYPPDEGIILPEGAEVGDVVETFNTSGYVIGVLAPTGETVNGYAAAQANPGRTKFTKCSDTAWLY